MLLRCTDETFYPVGVVFDVLDYDALAEQLHVPSYDCADFIEQLEELDSIDAVIQRVEKPAAFAGMRPLVKWRAQGTFRAARFAFPRRPGYQELVTRDITGGWRVTWILRDEPIGHTVRKTAQEALDSVEYGSELVEVWT